jgi:hypothetical protein
VLTALKLVKQVGDVRKLGFRILLEETENVGIAIV